MLQQEEKNEIYYHEAILFHKSSFHFDLPANWVNSLIFSYAINPEKSLTVSKFRLHCLNRGLLFLSGFLDMDFTWSMLLSTYGNKVSPGRYRHSCMSCVRTFLTASDIFLKHHLFCLRWRIQKSLVKRNFLLTFKQHRSKTLEFTHGCQKKRFLVSVRFSGF